MSRTSSTPIPKAALGGTPGASGTGGHSGHNGAAMNRATRRLLNRALTAAQTGDTRQVAAILGSLTGQPTPTGGAGGGGGGQRQRQQPQNLNLNLGTINSAVAGTNSREIAQLFRSMQGSDATRAEAVSLVVLLAGLRDEDLTTLTAPDIFNLCRQAAIFGLTFTTMTRPVTGARQNQNQNQAQQHQTGSRSSRRRNRNRHAATV